MSQHQRDGAESAGPVASSHPDTRGPTESTVEETARVPGGPQNRTRQEALAEFLTRSRLLAAGAPQEVKAESPWWRRAIRLVLKRLHGFDMAWQREFNHTAVTALEYLALEGQLLESSLIAARSDQQDLIDRIDALGASLHSLDVRLAAADSAWQARASEQQEHSLASERRLVGLEEQVREERQRFRGEVTRIIKAGANMRLSLVDSARRLSATENTGELLQEQLRSVDHRFVTLKIDQDRAAQEDKETRKSLLETFRNLTRRSEEDRMVLGESERRVSVLEQDKRRARNEEEDLRSRIETLTDRIEQEEIEFDVQTFADRFRGSKEEIQERLRPYIDLMLRSGLKEIGPILELGSGRGEFLELCKEAGLDARGFDRDAAQVQAMRASDLNAEVGEIPACLQSLAEGSAAAVVAVQVIEHLPPGGLQRLIREAHRVLRPGGLLILESLNPACLSVFANTFYRDPSHRRPLHPDTIAFLMEEAGFADVRIATHSPVPESAVLGPLPVSFRNDDTLVELGLALDQRMEKLDQLLFSDQEYHVIGARP